MRSTVAPPPDKLRVFRRAARLSAQQLLWELSAVDRLRQCGRVSVTPGGAVRVRATGSVPDRRAGFAGLMICGSVWSCPVCSAKILARRADELAEGVQTWADAGNSVGMLTLTMRHRKWQTLRDLWDALSYAWRQVVSSGTWKRTTKALGLAGYVRVVEVTHGGNGWHVHVHVGLFLRGVPTPGVIERLGNAAWSSWVPALAARGLQAPLRDSGGLHVALWDGKTGVLADYFTKNVYETDSQKVALELARGDLKAARGGNRTPFRILADVGAFGLVEDVELWQEWEAASKGRRQMTWGRDTRAMLGIGEEATDEEVAAEEEGTQDDDLVQLDAGPWRTVCFLGIRDLILDAAEADEDGTTLRRYLDSRGIRYRNVRLRVPA